MNRTGFGKGEIIAQTVALREPTAREVAEFGVTASGHCAVNEVIMSMRRFEFAGEGLTLGKPPAAYVDTASAFAAFDANTPDEFRADVARGFIAAMFLHFDNGNRLRAIDVGRAFIETHFALEEAAEGRHGRRRFNRHRLALGNFYWSAGELGELARDNTIVIDPRQQNEIFERRDKLVDRWQKAGTPDLTAFMTAV